MFSKEFSKWSMERIRNFRSVDGVFQGIFEVVYGKSQFINGGVQGIFERSVERISVYSLDGIFQGIFEGVYSLDGVLQGIFEVVYGKDLNIGHSGGVF